MSRNGSGTYTLPAGNPVVTGTTISSTWANSTLTDIAATLTDSVAADGQTPMTGNLNLSNNKIVNVTDPTLAQDASTKAYVDAKTNGTSAGSFTTLAASGATTLSSTLGVTGAATFTAGTASTSTTTGTAVITGGLGVSGRINAANFDGIVGANTAAAGNFTTLGATGVATFSAGTVSAPAITTTGDTNTGIYFPAADTIAFTEGGTEAMRIASTGNISLGPVFTAAGAENTTQIQANDNAIIYSNANTTSNLVRQYFFNPNGTVGSISTSGSSTTYATSSDYRLKENVAPMTGALAKVAQLKPVTYKWKSDGSDGQGFIAHELQSVVPDAVTGEKDAVNADGTIKPQGIDTSYVVATLTAALQELKAELDGVKAELATLKA